MANSTTVVPWNLTIPAGSLVQYTFTFSTVDPSTGQTTPYTITGATWEYVVRTSATDTTPGGVFNLTTTPSVNGSLQITSSSTLSQALLTINPGATATLAPNTYYHALWMNPGSATAYTWVTGSFVVVGNPQP